MKAPVHDIIAGVVAVVALLGVIYLEAVAAETPPELTLILGASVSWLYRGYRNGELSGKDGPK